MFSHLCSDSLCHVIILADFSLRTLIDCIARLHDPIKSIFKKNSASVMSGRYGVFDKVDI